MALFAHSPQDPSYPYQTLDEHLAQVGVLAATFLPKFDPQWGEMAGMTHDFGMAPEVWPRYLMDASQHKDKKFKSPGHTIHGAVFHYQHRNLPLAMVVMPETSPMGSCNYSNGKSWFRHRCPRRIRKQFKLALRSFQKLSNK